MKEFWLDKDRKEIKIHSKITVEDYGDEVVTVTGLLDPDGDVDDHGRAYTIPAAVTFVFDDGSKDKVNASQHNGYGPDYEYLFLEVTVVKDES